MELEKWPEICLMRTTRDPIDRITPNMSKSEKIEVDNGPLIDLRAILHVHRYI